MGLLEGLALVSAAGLLGAYLFQGEQRKVSKGELITVAERCYTDLFYKGTCFLEGATSTGRSFVIFHSPNSPLQVYSDWSALYPTEETRLFRCFPGLTASKWLEFAHSQPFSPDFNTIMLEEASGEYLVAATRCLLTGLLPSLPPALKQNLTGREQTYSEAFDSLLKTLHPIAMKRSGLDLFSKAKELFPEMNYRETLENAFKIDLEARSCGYNQAKIAIERKIGSDLSPFFLFLQKLEDVLTMEARRDSVELRQKEETSQAQTIKSSLSYL